MAPVPLQPKQKSIFMVSGDNRSQKTPILTSPNMLGSKTEAE